MATLKPFRALRPQRVAAGEPFRLSHGVPPEE
jgi:hypothetical protein